MVQIAVVEAQQRLPELLNAVEAGEEVEIRAENGRTYRLAPAGLGRRLPECRKRAA